jgi:hypothetical protein
MPTISVFYGIYIRMYVRDHQPPHFHAIYGAAEAYVSIDTGEVIKGKLPKAATRLVREWVNAERAALMKNWRHAQMGEPLERIAGLDAAKGR